MLWSVLHRAWVPDGGRFSATISLSPCDLCFAPWCHSLCVLQHRSGHTYRRVLLSKVTGDSSRVGCALSTPLLARDGLHFLPRLARGGLCSVHRAWNSAAGQENCLDWLCPVPGALAPALVSSVLEASLGPEASVEPESCSKTDLGRRRDWGRETGVAKATPGIHLALPNVPGLHTRKRDKLEIPA